MSYENNSTGRSGIYAFRWIENAHILLWLIKDTCWALEWKTGGIIMIIPTVFVAFYLLWRARHHRSESFHNLAICIWIVANASWMLGEFFGHDLRPVAVGLFTVGLTVLAVYYLTFFRKDQQRHNAEATAPGVEHKERVASKERETV